MKIDELKKELQSRSLKELEGLHEFIEDIIYADELEAINAPSPTPDEIKKEQERIQNDPAIMAKLDERLERIMEGRRIISQKAS